MSPRQKLLLLLASARLANLPSVVSNVWLGVALGVYAQGASGMGPPWSAALQLSLCGVLLYAGGNFLNDWHDRHWDAQHRPERALPQGAFAPATYLALAVLCAAAGLGLAFLTNRAAGLVATLIVFCILLYTHRHKRDARSVVLLGLCRALLPLLFFSVWPLGNLGQGPFASRENSLIATCFFIPHAFALMIYITALSLAARRESVAARPAGSPDFARVLLGLAGLCMVVWSVPVRPLAAGAGLLLYGLWLGRCFTRYRQPIQRQVAALLAGIPLLDWVALLPLALAMMAQGRPLSFTLSCLLLPPLAFVSGCLLQRVAPAT